MTLNLARSICRISVKKTFKGNPVCLRRAAIN
jgi:hypothetical protein